MATVLKNKYPDTRVTMLVREYARDLIAGHPDIDEIITVKRESDVAALVPALREKQFTSVFCPSPTFMVARAVRSADIPIRIGTAYRWYSRLLFTEKIYDHRKPAQYHEVQANVRMIDNSLRCTPETLPLRMVIDDESKSEAREWLAEQGIVDGTPFAVVHPGSGGSAKDLPVEQFARIAARLRDECGFRVVVTGVASEMNLLCVMKDMTGIGTCAVGFPLRMLAALLADARCLVTNSTGVLHIGAAVGTYVAGMYPPILACSPKRWGPWTENADVFVPPVEENCNGCEDTACPYFYCMRLIAVEDIMKKIKERVAP